MGNAIYVGGGGIWGISVPSSQFCGKPKSALKKMKKKNFQKLHIRELAKQTTCQMTGVFSQCVYLDTWGLFRIFINASLASLSFTP